MTSAGFPFFVLLILSCGAGAQKYMVAGKGRFLCNRENVPDLKVQLVEKSYYGFDRVLSEQQTNLDGDFWIVGNFSRDGVLKTTSSWLGFPATPYLYVEHECPYEFVSEDVTVNCVGGTFRRTIPELFVHQIDEKSDFFLYDMETVDLSEEHGDFLGFDAVFSIYDKVNRCKKVQKVK